MSLKRNGKDTVFSSYFNIKENALKAVNALFKDSHYHIDDIQVNTLDPTIVNGRYNDLSIQIKDQYVVLVEAQSKWSINILIRCLIYYLQILEQYIHEQNLDLHSTTKVDLPKPEFYCVYSGSKKVKDVYSLAEDFFCDKDSWLDIKVHIIHQRNEKEYGIFQEYLHYTRIYNEVTQEMGYTIEAARVIIERCIKENCLKEYMIQHQSEVLNMVLYVLTQEFAEKAREYQENKRRQEELEKAKEEVTKEVTKQVTKEVTKQNTLKFAKELKNDGVPLEKIIKYTKLTKEEIDNL